MNRGEKIGRFLALLAATNAALLGETAAAHTSRTGGILTVAGLLALFALLNLRPLGRTAAPTRRIRQLECGCALLRQFLATATVNAVWLAVIWFAAIRTLPQNGGWNDLVLAAVFVLPAVTIALLEAVLFWNGMLRIYFTSVQLGLKHRILAALCGWIPLVNLWYLGKLIRITADEVEFETEKWELDAQRAESAVCKTRYPILLVHGVFFRDYRYVNYWGRIPRELLRNGASVYYGGQQSAASVEESGGELAARIRAVLAETGCEKVNIIAHSKGGLDARWAVSRCGCGPYVASLTTVNTPHRGCLFAEYLLEKMPQAARQKLADAYNAALRKLGDARPDFLAAVRDLTASRCQALDREMPDVPGVLCESVMSYCRRARSGQFPLNVTYPLVRHFDGKNDGLVAVDSARWGSRFTLVEPAGKRGISHGDVIDLNRENLPGFDVREFYVNLVAGLKDRGL